jgi:hypothetical protein
MTTLTIIMLSVPIAIAILAILAEPSIVAAIYTPSKPAPTAEGPAQSMRRH